VLRLGSREGATESAIGLEVSGPLITFESYYWRAWTDDGVEDSEKIVTVFETCVY